MIIHSWAAITAKCNMAQWASVTAIVLRAPFTCQKHRRFNLCRYAGPVYCVGGIVVMVIHR